MFEEQQICACSGHSLGKAPPEPSHLGEKGSWDSEAAPSTGKHCSHWDRQRCHPSPCPSPGAALLQEMGGGQSSGPAQLHSSTPLLSQLLGRHRGSCRGGTSGWLLGAIGAIQYPQGITTSWSCPGPSGAWCWLFSMAQIIPGRPMSLLGCPTSLLGCPMFLLRCPILFIGCSKALL